MASIGAAFSTGQPWALKGPKELIPLSETALSSFLVCCMCLWASSGTDKTMTLTHKSRSDDLSCLLVIPIWYITKRSISSHKPLTLANSHTFHRCFRQLEGPWQPCVLLLLLMKHPRTSSNWRRRPSVHTVSTWGLFWVFLAYFKSSHGFASCLGIGGSPSIEVSVPTTLSTPTC